ncbi:phosphate:Na+ symporter [[Clostridium] aminophilum]|uniref:Phosphate:Na+ symporter n=1 Tax=[Clostridium] aminophilum TaxID=1526 RepID=A0A1I0I9B9_9FIRM|nr:Na/Pi cotransporter family protein [[Clostridium] aminophilum]SET93175.1 phosphate:Na+ symporter [[Clostridium] aminophilum]
MDIFSILNLIGGLSLFLFGMSLMGQALERRAGSRLKMLLGKLTTNRITGLTTGLGVTAVIQSSSATTVMVVGFVNSGLMTLRQAINVIMGANVGTTVTAWILSLSGISSDNVFVKLLKPSSFTPILALFGIILYMFTKESKKRDTGMILLGFATLMFGMEAMSGAVSGLRDFPAFQNMFVAFANPVLGVLAGAILTAIIQSSSASVGILQALASTGAVTYGAAIPIIMGQNIGTCITAIISAVGANKNAKRAALVHLSFNVIGTVVWLSIFCIVKAVAVPAILGESASLMGIAVCHSAFNILCTLLMLPLAGMLEKMVKKMIPDNEVIEQTEELDPRLLGSPSLALERCGQVLHSMAGIAVAALKDSIGSITRYDEETALRIREAEEKTDHLEDILGTYLVKLTSTQLGENESAKATEYMKVIGDYERIADHAVNILESAEELVQKGIVFSDQAQKEYNLISDAVEDILDLSHTAFKDTDLKAARKTEPLEQIVDELKETLRTRHILRLQKGECSVDAGFVWSDLLTNLERVADHCSNISGCVLDTAGHTMNIHQNQRLLRNSGEDFGQELQELRVKYKI